MDPLSTLLDPGGHADVVGVRGPWTIALTPLAPLTLLAVAEGEAWLRGERGSTRLQTGDLVLLQGRAGRVLSSTPAPAGAPAAVPGRAWSIDGEEGPGGTRLLLRSLPGGGGAAGLVDSLAPDQIFTTARDSTWWQPLRDEAGGISVGGPVAMSCLLDLLLVEALRRWVTQGEARGWIRAVLDPCVGGALTLLHDSPEHPWTLQEIADRVGTSRSTLSRRFQILLGESPMTYLREWRLTRAATLLTEDGVTVAAAARRSGFTDPFAFSAAFSKKFGVAPRRYRVDASTAGSA